jgi:hypothetical protein
MAGLDQGAAQGEHRGIAAGHSHATGGCLGLADNLSAHGGNAHGATPNFWLREGVNDGGREANGTA